MKLTLFTIGLGFFIATLGDASAHRRPRPGPKRDCCKWTDWQDRDNPSGKCDCEDAPDDCKVMKYQIQLTSGGTVWDDINASGIPNIFTHGLVNCFNSNQPGCPVNSQGYATDLTDKRCCRDYRVKFCCEIKKTKPIFLELADKMSVKNFTLPAPPPQN